MPSVKSKNITSNDRFNEAVDTIARLQVQVAAVKAKRDKEIQGVNERYKAELEPLEDKRDLQLKLAEEYAAENREELFPKGAKSSETTHALYGFRTGQPTVKVLSKKWTWDKVVDALKAKYGSRFVRTKEEPDKDAIRADLGAGEQAEVGLRVEQEDRFFVEPLVETGERVVAG